MLHVISKQVLSAYCIQSGDLTKIKSTQTLSVHAGMYEYGVDWKEM